jgi:hypothetical protein
MKFEHSLTPIPVLAVHTEPEFVVLSELHSCSLHSSLRHMRQMNTVKFNLHLLNQDFQRITSTYVNYIFY